MMDPWIWLGVCIFLAFTIEAITGFGSIVIALSMGALLLPIPEIVPVLVPLNVCLSGYLTFRHRRHIHWPLLLKMVLPLMLAGTLAGYFMMPWLGAALLKVLFGLLVFCFSARELWRLMAGNPARPHSVTMSRVLTFCAGITHGLFASGGPLLVYALAGIQLDKGRTRATLLSVWFSLNASLSLLFLVDGRLAAGLPAILYYLPLVALGVLVGEFLHHRLDDRRFRQAVFAVLLVTGVLLMVPGLADLVQSAQPLSDALSGLSATQQPKM